MFLEQAGLFSSTFSVFSSQGLLCCILKVGVCNIRNLLFPAVGLIIAILIPVAVAVLVGVVTSVLCYRKREW